MKAAIAIGLLLALSSTGFAAVAGNAPLVDAARAANWNVVRTLIAQGARGEVVNAADSDGSRPLHWAVRADELQVVDLLLRAGADAKAENRLGVTPLYLAAQNGNAAIIRRLLDAGANANQVDRMTGETLLMVATKTGAADAVQTLLKAGADPNATEPQLQLTALMMASEAGHTEVVRSLLDHEADVLTHSTRNRARTLSPLYANSPTPKTPSAQSASDGPDNAGD